MIWASLQRSGWGRVASGRMEVARPVRTTGLAAVLAEGAPNGLLAIGAGRSYGDAAIASDGRAVLSQRLDRLLAFDEETGLLVAEPGVSVAAILSSFLARGWSLPATPGTGAVTLGGAVAADVHGKDHPHAGSFGRQLAWLDLLDADGGIRRLSPDADSELFDATIGGMGLTGIVTRVAVRLRKVPSATLAVRRVRAASFDDVVELLRQASAESAFAVAWIDALASEGRGVVERADWVECETVHGADTPLRIPLTPPVSLLRPALMRRYNRRHFRRAASGAEPAQRFFFPLDKIEGWNRLYGPRGFHQLQFAVPEIGPLRAVLQSCDIRPTLVVLKRLGEAGRGLLSFPRPGWTLALDLPNQPGATALLQRLHAMIAEAEGRVYLAKDATMQPAQMARMYPELDRFRAVAERADPRRVFQSDLSRRLGLR